MGEKRNAYIIMDGDLDVDGKIILRWTLNEDGTCGLCLCVRMRSNGGLFLTLK
jgi:hypothetical protein